MSLSSICRNSTLIEINSDVDCCCCCSQGSNAAKTNNEGDNANEYLLLNECCIGENRNELTLNRSFTLAKNATTSSKSCQMCDCKLEKEDKEISRGKARESDDGEDSDNIIINENSITYNYLYEPDENDTECRRIEIIDDDSDMSNSIIISDHRGGCRRHLLLDECCSSSLSSSLVNDCNKHYYENEITINNTQSNKHGESNDYDYDDDQATIITTTTTTTTTKKSPAFEDVQIYFFSLLLSFLLI